MSLDGRRAGAGRWRPGQGDHAGRRLGANLAASEVRRLGKPGAYRLGQLRSKGVPGRRPPTPFRARFARRHDRRWPNRIWLLGLLIGVVVIAASAAVGWWFVPLLVGLGAGVANRAGGRRAGTGLGAVAVMAVVGWGLPFWLGIPHGNRGGALSRLAGSVTGLAGDAAGVVALTVLIAMVQALVGYVIGHAISPRLLDDQIR